MSVNDYESIRNLLARFVHLRDDKHFEEWAELFSVDGIFEYGGKVLIGRQAIASDVAELLRWDRGKHLWANPVIELDGDCAKVLSDFVKLQRAGGSDTAPELVLQVMGRYEDELVRVEGRWFIARRRVHLASDGGRGAPDPGV